MDWNEKYDQDTRPSFEDVRAFINNGLWDGFCRHIEDAYNVSPAMEYSRCSGQPGWNIKYKKGGRSLCTLYPMPGYFIALVVIGNKEQSETELMLPSMTVYTRTLYESVPFSLGGRWLMIEVRDEAVLNDVKALVQIRAKPKNK